MRAPVTMTRAGAIIGGGGAMACGNSFRFWNFANIFRRVTQSIDIGQQLASTDRGWGGSRSVPSSASRFQRPATTPVGASVKVVSPWFTRVIQPDRSKVRSSGAMRAT